MGTSYLLIILMYNTATQLFIGAQTFEMNSIKECMQLREYSQQQFEKHLPPEIKGQATCFKQLGGKEKEA